MTIDLQTLLFVTGLVVTISTISFVLNTVLKRNDEVGRLWSVAFICGILTSLASAATNLDPDAWLILAVGNSALTLSVGLMWCGCRSYNGRSPRVWVALLVALAAGVAVVVRGADGGPWAGAVEQYLAVAAVSLLAGSETLRSRLRSSLSARLLTVGFFGFGVFFLTRSVVFIVDGAAGQAFTSWVGPETTAAVTVALVIVAAISMSVLQSGRQLRHGEIAGGEARSIPGVLPRPVFDQLAADWLERTRLERDRLVLLIFDLDNLEHISSAFGRTVHDEVLRSAGRVACLHAPASALIGQIGHHGFLILTTTPAVGGPTVVAERLQTALAEAPSDEVDGIRPTATWGLASTDELGYDLENLTDAAFAAVRAARGSGVTDTPAHPAAAA